MCGTTKDRCSLLTTLNLPFAQIAKTQKAFDLHATSNEATLRVKNVKNNAQGLYTCIAQNKHGKDAIDIELTVVGAFLHFPAIKYAL